MMTKIFAPLTAALCLAATGAAAGPLDDMATGYAACLAGAGDAQVVYELLSGEGWEGDVDNEAGIGYVYPPSGDKTIVTVGMDGTWCNVENTTESSRAAAELFKAMIEGEYAVNYGRDGMGCSRFDLGETLSATVYSAGQDPTCAAKDSNAIYFEYWTE